MRNLLLTFCSGFIMFGGFLTFMFGGFIPSVVTFAVGFLLFVISLLKKPVLHKFAVIISFVLFLIAHGCFSIPNWQMYFGLNIAYGILDVFIFVMPLAFFVVSLVSIIRRSQITNVQIPEIEATIPEESAEPVNVLSEVFFCPNCGSKQRIGTAFCGECGTSCANIVSADEYDRLHKG